MSSDKETTSHNKPYMGEYNTPEIITAAKNGDVEKLKRLLNSGSYVGFIECNRP